MAIHSFEILSVPVSDQRRARNFYRDVLGFALIREEPMGPGMSWIQLAPLGHSGLRVRPNVRGKRATAAGRLGPAGENVPRTTGRAKVACRWRSA